MCKSQSAAQNIKSLLCKKHTPGKIGMCFFCRTHRCALFCFYGLFQGLLSRFSASSGVSAGIRIWTAVPASFVLRYVTP